MTNDELRAARETWGLTQTELARVFDVSVRTVISWEKGGRNGHPSPIPLAVAVLVQLALKHAHVRLALGIPSKGKMAATADKKGATRSKDEAAATEP